MIRKRDLIVVLALLLVALVPLAAFAAGPDKAKAELDKINIPFTDAAFTESVARGDSKVVSLFLEAGMNPDTSDKFGEAAIIIAATKGHGKVLVQLLENGADPDAVERNDWTALMYAAIYHAHGPQSATALIDAGANIDRQDKMAGRSALMEASDDGNLKVLNLLLNAGADRSLKDKNGNTALDFAKQREYKRIIDALEKTK